MVIGGMFDSDDQHTSQEEMDELMKPQLYVGDDAAQSSEQYSSGRQGEQGMCDDEAEEISDKVIDRYNRKKEDVWGIGGRYLSAGYGTEQPDEDNEDDLMREGDPLSLD